MQRKGLKSCRDLEYNWLGTDDQGRDVVARLIYGFRISVLFGLSLTIISSIIGIAAGGVQGYFGGPRPAPVARVRLGPGPSGTTTWAPGYYPTRRVARRAAVRQPFRPGGPDAIMECDRELADL